MNPFIPPECLLFDEAIDRVVDLRRGDAEPLINEEEAERLRDFRARIDSATRPKPQPVVPVPKAGDRRRFAPSKITTFKAPDTPATDAPARHNLTKEEWRDLLNRETQLEERRYAARGELQKALWTGRLAAIVIAEDGSPRVIPKHLWGSNQWHKLLRTGEIQWFERGLVDTVSGRPLIPRDALEAVFNPDGTAREEVQAEPESPKETSDGEVPNETLCLKRERWEKRQRDLMSGNDPDYPDVEIKTFHKAAEIIAGAEGQNVDVGYVERETRRVRRDRQLKRGK